MIQHAETMLLKAIMTPKRPTTNILSLCYKKAIMAQRPPRTNIQDLCFKKAMIN